jgi:hypothetical protein
MQLPRNPVGLQSFVLCWLPVSWKRLFVIIVDFWKLSTTLLSCIVWRKDTWLYLLVWFEGWVHSSWVLNPVVFFLLGNSQTSEFYMPMLWNSVSKCRRIKLRHRGITQKKAYNIKNTASLKSRMCNPSFKIFIISVGDSMSHFTWYNSTMNWI